MLFFFQAEDGIRDGHVTGVQTCALPISNAYAQTLAGVFTTESKPFEVELVVAELGITAERDQLYRLSYDGSVIDETEHRSEERRVGKKRRNRGTRGR